MEQSSNSESTMIATLTALRILIAKRNDHRSSNANNRALTIWKPDAAPEAASITSKEEKASPFVISWTLILSAMGSWMALYYLFSGIFRLLK
jgi:hypothetical protein